MPLSLHVDGQKWRSHLSAMISAKPGLVPVIKGNGYGFGLEFLGAEATRLGVETVAVGLASEVAKVRAAFSGEIIVLSPDGQEKTQLTENQLFTQAWAVNKQTGTIVVTGHYDSNNNKKYDKTDKNAIYIYDLVTLKLISKI